MREKNDWMQPFAQETISDPYTTAKNNAFNADLLRLLAARTDRYTMGDSSSVPIETAGELLKSICFSLELACEAQGLNMYALPENTKLPELLLAGQAEIERRIATGKKLLKQALPLLEGVDDLVFHETISEIAQFFKRYDMQFFAHGIPCDIDYLLDMPISENLQGIDYINAYLKEIIAEGDEVPLLRKHEEARLNELLVEDNAMQHIDGEAMDDEALRTLIEELNDRRNITDKIAMIRQTVCSLRDMIEVLDVCFWGDECIAIFDMLQRAELALLYRFAKNRANEKCSPTGWEQSLYRYLADKVK